MPDSHTGGVPRKLVVFGASGNVGRLVVRQALSAGDEVTAYLRDPRKLDVEPSAQLRVVVGELSDAAMVGEAVDGADAVISALGPALGLGISGLPLVDGTRHIVDAMVQAGVTRFVGMATPSVADPRDRRTVLGIAAPLVARTLLSRAYRELIAMSDVVMGSELQWTIARFSRPTDGPPTGLIRAGFLGHTRLGLFIARADIAAFLLGQVDDDRFLRAAPVISN